MDETAPVRSMSEAALKAEANSLDHRMGHFPQNPYCRYCKLANLRQRRFAKTSAPEPDGLPNPGGPVDQFSSDFIIVAPTHSDPKKSRTGHTVIHTV